MGCEKLTYYQSETPLKVVYRKTVKSENIVQRFLSVDPLAEKYPNMGAFVYCNGNPVRFVNLDGLKAQEPPRDQYSIVPQSPLLKVFYQQNKQLELCKSKLAEHILTNQGVEITKSRTDAIINSITIKNPIFKEQSTMSNDGPTSAGETEQILVGYEGLSFNIPDEYIEGYAASKELKNFIIEKSIDREFGKVKEKGLKALNKVAKLSLEAKHLNLVENLLNSQEIKNGGDARMYDKSYRNQKADEKIAFKALANFLFNLKNQKDNEN